VARILTFSKTKLKFEKGKMALFKKRKAVEENPSTEKIEERVSKDSLSADNQKGSETFTDEGKKGSSRSEEKEKPKKERKSPKVPVSEESEKKPKAARKARKHLGIALRLTIIITLVTAVVTAAFVLTQYILLPVYHNFKTRKEIKQEIKPAENKKVKKKNKEIGQVYEIKDLTVNTFGSDGRRYVVIEIALETINSAVIEELKSRDPQIRDLLIKYLRACSAEQILDINFQEYSRIEITRLINQRLFSGQIDSLYFTMLVVQ